MTLHVEKPLHWKVYGKRGVSCGRSALRVRYTCYREDFKERRAKGEKVCRTCSMNVDTETQS